MNKWCFEVVGRKTRAPADGAGSSRRGFGAGPRFFFELFFQYHLEMPLEEWLGLIRPFDKKTLFVREGKTFFANLFHNAFHLGKMEI